MKQTIMKAIEFSELAYPENKRKLNNLIKEKNNGSFVFDIKKTDTQGFFLIDEDAKVNWLSVRGSTSWEDWRTNFKIHFANKSPYGKVHAGFYKNALSIRDVLRKAQYESPYRTIYTGHSQGGAIALQCFLNDPLMDSICITIEAPRSCSKKAASLAGKFRGGSVWSIVHNSSIVRILPPKTMGYAHVTKTNIQYIDRNGKIRNGLPWYRKHMDVFLGIIKGFGTPGLDFIKDHNLSTIKKHWANHIKEEK